MLWPPLFVAFWCGGDCGLPAGTGFAFVWTGGSFIVLDVFWVTLVQ